MSLFSTSSKYNSTDSTSTKSRFYCTSLSAVYCSTSTEYSTTLLRWSYSRWQRYHHTSCTVVLTTAIVVREKRSVCLCATSRTSYQVHASKSLTVHHKLGSACEMHDCRMTCVQFKRNTIKRYETIMGFGYSVPRPSDLLSFLFCITAI